MNNNANNNQFNTLVVTYCKIEMKLEIIIISDISNIYFVYADVSGKVYFKK